MTETEASRFRASLLTYLGPFTHTVVLRTPRSVSPQREKTVRCLLTRDSVVCEDRFAYKREGQPGGFPRLFGGELLCWVADLKTLTELAVAEPGVTIPP